MTKDNLIIKFSFLLFHTYVQPKTMYHHIILSYNNNPNCHLLNLLENRTCVYM